MRRTNHHVVGWDSHTTIPAAHTIRRLYYVGRTLDEGQTEYDRIKLIGTVANSAVAVVAGSIPAGGTGAAAGGWDTAGNRNTAITTITEIKTQLNALIVALQAKGLIS
ncbi:MAG: hypothetical protein HC794_01595 [Nitrospiraceae bacterium]|nr:hypothetical protein [Nitrospiraceae bacterium]